MVVPRFPVASRTLMLLLGGVLCLSLMGCGQEPERDKFKRSQYYGPVKPKEDTGGGGGGASTDNKPGTGPANGSLDYASAGSIRGVMRYKGKVKPRAVIDVSKDSFCLKNHTGKVKKEGLVVDAKGGVRDFMVHISSGMNGLKFEAPAESAKLIQDGCYYQPHVLVLRAGQKLDIVNVDETTHNFHFFGIENPEVNKSQSGPRTDSVYLDNPEIGAFFKCDFHPWMLCNVHVLTHPFHVVTGPDGSFEIKGVPPGRYEVSFIHEQLVADPVMVDVKPREAQGLGDVVATQ